MTSKICNRCKGKHQEAGALCSICRVNNNGLLKIKQTDQIYGTARWKRFRDWYKRSHPLCESCAAKGMTTPAYCVDHINEIKDGGAVFDESNCQSLCRSCHAKKTTQKAKARGKYQ